jgi:hypothetical protein
MTLSRSLIPVLVISAFAVTWGQVTAPQQPQLRTGIASGTQRVPAKNGQTKAATTATKESRSATKTTPTPVPTPTPVTSPTPMEAMKPADMPPVPPQVTFKNGLLTVNAVNSTLSSLLTAIRNKTGIEFEGAELAGQDRVAISMGPASEGEVLASILSGSNVDYVVMGRPDSPTIVQRVLLTRRTRPGAATVANGQPTPNPGGQQEGGEEEGQDENAVDPDQPQPQDTAVQPPPAQQPPDGQAQQQPADQQQPGQPKTPEQLLQELKDMQQKQSGQTPDPNSAPRKLPPR